MKQKALLLTFGVVAIAGLAYAYGVNPSQYTQGKAADAQNPSIPGAPAPNPLTLSQVAPGAQPQIQMANQQPQNYDAMAVPDWAKAWKHFHWEESKAMWENRSALFLDARAKSEYDQGHIPGAIPMPLSEFDTYYPKYEKQIKAAKMLVTYCHGVGCQLSNKVAQKLFNDPKDPTTPGKGLKHVGSFFGGWPQWQQHNMPVETGPEPKRK